MITESLINGFSSFIVLFLELGVNEDELEPCLYPGGETEALTRLKKYMERKVGKKKKVESIRLSV